MTHFKKASFFALFAALVFAFAAPASAQAQNQQDQEAAQVNAGNLISALNNINANIQDVQALNDLTVSDVQVVNVQDVLNNTKAFNKALQNADIKALTEFLNNNQVLNDALNQNNVAVSDVVAVSVLSGGEVVLYYQQQDE